MTSVNGSWWGLPWLLALCALVLAMTWMIYPARGHSWYDTECCSGKDCKAVDTENIEHRDGGTYVNGKLIEPRKIKRSKDDQWHVCYGRAYTWPVPGFEVRCLYKPEETS
jgi:hypothetical protein